MAKQFYFVVSSLEITKSIIFRANMYVVIMG